MDRMKIIQILTNLLANAIKFTPKDKNVQLNVTNDKKNIVLRVIDEGIGIPKSRQTAIFEVFAQADQSTTR